MHNRKKLDRPRSTEEIEAEQKKCATYNKMLSLLLHHYKMCDYSAEALELTSKMLKTNPDIYSLWNYRREILKTLYSSIGLSDSTTPIIPSDIGASILRTELHISAEAIKKNPKSYGAWHHRKWIIARVQCDIDAELALCNEFLRADQRNFHCWNYRRHVIALGKVSPQAEFDFAGTKIRENFSNYSAFHHRSVMIKKLDASSLDRSFLDGELNIIENAVFTEPDDQSAWWYHEFLLDWAQKQFGEDVMLDVLMQQRASMQSLLEVEEKAKWVMLALVSILTKLLHLNNDQGTTDNLAMQRRDLLQRLKGMDVAHAKRYDYLLARSVY